MHEPFFRGEIKDNVTDVVPSFDLLIPKNKDLAPVEDVSMTGLILFELQILINILHRQNIYLKKSAFQKNAYYLDAMKHGYENMESPGMFTSVGKLRLKTGKTNCPVGLYSDETLMELSSGGGHGFVE